MKLEKIDLKEFAALISNARGRVTFVTEEGDRLVAGSLLSALVGLASILKVSQEQRVDMIFENPEDRKDFEAFFAETRNTE